MVRSDKNKWHRVLESTYYDRLDFDAEGIFLLIATIDFI